MYFNTPNFKYVGYLHKINENSAFRLPNLPIQPLLLGKQGVSQGYICFIRKKARISAGLVE